jgi:SAM-dependent methyltransferase
MDNREQFQGRASIGRFTCNVCGAENKSSSGIEDRERATCDSCGSTMRFRSIVLALSRALFGMDLALCDFPLLKSLRGLGFSDSEVYAGRLEEHFNYVNTFYHREPTFDLSRPSETEFGRYDFVICSEVLEHVAPPVERAFEVLARLLKPAGALILTVPYSLANETVEHFANLHKAVLVEIDGRTVLVNRSGHGKYEVFDQLTFHGGPGSTLETRPLEMRLFCEADVRAKLTAAGLSKVRFDATGSQEFGVLFSSPCSLPIVAEREPFSLGASGIRELTEQLVAVRKGVRESRWLRLGRLLGLGPDIRFASSASNLWT